MKNRSIEMKKSTICEKYEKKVDGKWVETYYTEDEAIVYRALAHCLRAQYIGKVNWITRITDRPNYDDTNTMVIYEENGGRRTIVYEP